MSTERRRSLRSDSSRSPSSSGQQTTAQKSSLYPTEELKKLAGSFHSEALDADDGVVHRKSQHSFIQRTRNGSLFENFSFP